MEKTTEQFARDLAIASGDLPDTPAGPAPGVPTWRLDYLPVAQALTLARRTEADIRADERERVCTLLSEEFGNQLDGLDGRDIADWLRSHTQGEE